VKLKKIIFYYCRIVCFHGDERGKSVLTWVSYAIIMIYQGFDVFKVISESRHLNDSIHALLVSLCLLSLEKDV